MTERDVSPVAGRSGFTRAHGAMALGGVAVVALGFVFLRGGHEPKKEQKGEALLVQATQHYEPAPPPPRPQVVPVVAQVPIQPPQSAPAVASVVAQPPDVKEKQTTPSIMAYDRGGTAAQRNDGATASATAQAGRETEFGQRLVPTRVTATAATVLKNQPYLLHKGDQILCVLNTAVNTTLPGSFTCKLPTPILGDTGITLIDGGSTIYGEVGGNMQQGENRAFGLAEDVRTPRGVVATLNSPVTDALGRTGMDVSVETHAGARILNSVLLGIASGGLQAAASMSGVGAGVMGGGGTQSAVADALRGSVNMRPTGVMNQGEIISVTLARDVDFSPVYSVSVR